MVVRVYYRRRDAAALPTTRRGEYKWSGQYHQVNQAADLEGGF